MTASDRDIRANKPALLTLLIAIGMLVSFGGWVAMNPFYSMLLSPFSIGAGVWTRRESAKVGGVGRGVGTFALAVGLLPWAVFAAFIIAGALG